MSSEQMFAFLDKNVRRLVNNNSCGNAQSKIEQHCAKMLSVIACCETKRNDNQPVPCGTVWTALQISESDLCLCSTVKHRSRSGASFLNWLASGTLRNCCTCEWKLAKDPGAFADFDLWALASLPFVSQFQLASARKSFKKLAPELESHLLVVQIFHFADFWRKKSHFVQELHVKSKQFASRVCHGNVTIFFFPNLEFCCFQFAHQNHNTSADATFYHRGLWTLCPKWLGSKGVFFCLSRTTSCSTNPSLPSSWHLEWLATGLTPAASGTMMTRTSWSGSMRRTTPVLSPWRKVETWNVSSRDSARVWPRWERPFCRQCVEQPENCVQTRRSSGQPDNVHK